MLNRILSLRRGRSVDLPADDEQAFFVLLPLILSHQDKHAAELLSSPNCTFNPNQHLSRSGDSLLHVAANTGAVEVLTVVLKRGADVDGRDKSGNTALHLTARGNHQRCFHRLLEFNADVNAVDKRSLTPLHWLAATRGQTELLQVAVERHGTRFDAEDNKGQTPLHMACQNGNRAAVARLLDYGAECEKKDHKGWTPLFFACRYGQLETVQHLLRCGALLQLDNEDLSPLDLCVEGGYAECTMALVERYPQLLVQLLRMVQSSRPAAVDEARVVTALDRLCRRDRGTHTQVVYSLGELTVGCGIELLSSPDSRDFVVDDFLRSVRVLLHLCAKPPSSPADLAKDHHHAASASRGGAFFRSNRAEPESSSRPADDDDHPFALLEPLWRLMRQWFAVLREELGCVIDSQQGDVAEDELFAPPGKAAPSVKPGKGETGAAVTGSATLSLDGSGHVALPRGGSLSYAPSTHPEKPRFMSVSASPAAKAAAAKGVSGLFSSGGELPSKTNAPNVCLSSEARSLAAAVVRTIPPELCKALLRGNRGTDAREKVSTLTSWQRITRSQYVKRQESVPAATQDAIPLDELVLASSAGGSDDDVKIPPSQSDDVSPGAPISQPGTTEVRDAPALAGDAPKQPAASAEPGGPACVEVGADDGRGRSEPPPGGSFVEVFTDRLCAVTHAFFLVCRAKARLRAGDGVPLDFMSFMMEHMVAMQALVLRNPELIFAHFAFLLESPQLLREFTPIIHAQKFEDRQKWFYENLHRGAESSTLEMDNVIRVSRSGIFQSSCEALMSMDAERLKNNFSVTFEGEEGIGTGVRREFFDQISSELLNPDYALFTLSVDGSTFQPNPNSHVNADHLSYFNFAGRLIGTAIYHRQLLSIYFTRSFYKHILGVPIDYTDVEYVDPDFAHSLQWLLDNSIDDLGLELTFSLEKDVFGSTRVVELKPGGAELAVTERNKREYVRLVAEERLTSGIQEQITAFLSGFKQLIPQRLVALFTEYELELLMSGVPDIDVDDWRRNTQYSGGYEETSDVIRWFWEVVGEQLDRKECILLLQFVTGSSRVPHGGFANLPGFSGTQNFNITPARRADDRPDALPTAATCFNMLKLPQYDSKEVLAERLLIALHYGSQGFEFT